MVRNHEDYDYSEVMYLNYHIQLIAESSSNGDKISSILKEVPESISNSSAVEQATTSETTLNNDAVIEKQTQPHCQFFVKRKKRLCTMTVKKGKSFCGEHQPVDPSVENSRQNDRQRLADNRVLCPLDPSHSVYTFKLQKHLRICNARKRTENLPSFVKKNINSCEDESVSADEDIKLRDLEASEIDKVTKIVEKLFDEHVAGKIQREVKSHNIFEHELKVETYGEDKIRHLLQTSSILGILEAKDLLKSHTCFIDLGAGKGIIYQNIFKMNKF